MFPTTIEILITAFTTLPAVGKKGATKIVTDYLAMTTKDQDQLLRALIDVRKTVTKCPICHAFSQNNEVCGICQDPRRDKSQIMIIRDPLDLVMVEKNNHYNNCYTGKYHVLNKLINPLEKIMFGDTTLVDLEYSIEKFFRDNLVDNLELIYFVKHSFASQITFAYIEDYISKSKKKERIKIVKLATGLPSNFNPQNVDSESFSNAYENRK